jgi:hypothetical protein
VNCCSPASTSCPPLSCPRTPTPNLCRLPQHHFHSRSGRPHPVGLGAQVL